MMRRWGSKKAWKWNRAKKRFRWIERFRRKKFKTGRRRAGKRDKKRLRKVCVVVVLRR
jgi:hypothetical protein